jgi:hypothetical protein
MINGSTVDFPGSKRPTPEQVAAQDSRGRAERISRLRDALGQNKQMGDEDQIVVAQALYDLLDRIEQKYRIRKREVLVAANIGSPDDSTKHLSQYAIPRGLAPEQIRKRRLTRKVGPYKRIAEAAARLAPDLDEGDILLEVFGRANFWREGVREAAPEFAELAIRLGFVADGISAKYDLTTFFREVERGDVSPAPTFECVQRDAANNHLFGEEIGIEYRQFEPGDIGPSFSGPVEFSQLTCLGEYESDGGGLPAYPAVILGAWKLGSPFPISIVRPVSEPKTPVSAQGWPAVVLRFCIAPIGKERSATPVLRVDLWGYIEVVEPTWTNHWAPLRPGRVIVANCEMNIERVPKLPSPFALSDIERHGSIGTWPQYPDILFLAINGMACEDWFRFPVFKNLYYAKEWPLADRALGCSLCEVPDLLPFSPFRSATLAALVDAALCDPTDGLDLLLEQQVKRLQAAFEASRAAARDSRDKGWEVVTKRWERDENP